MSTSLWTNPEQLAGRLSCADSAFPKVSHEVALAIIRDLGIAAVDVCVFAGYRHCPPAAVVDDPASAAAAVKKRVRAARLSVTDVFAILSDPYDELAVNHPDPDTRAEVLRQLRRVLTFAAKLGSPGVTVLPGPAFESVTPEENLSTAATQLQRLAEDARELGLALSIEPHYRSVAETPASALSLLDEAPDVTLTLDHGHFIFQGISQDDVDVLLPRARHLQLRQAAPRDMQTRAREGTIDYERLLAQLASIGYDGYLGLEYQWDHWMGFNRVDCISETAELRDVLLELAGAPGR